MGSRSAAWRSPISSCEWAALFLGTRGIERAASCAGSATQSATESAPAVMRRTPSSFRNPFRSRRRPASVAPPRGAHSDVGVSSFHVGRPSGKSEGRIFPTTDADLYEFFPTASRPIKHLDQSTTRAQHTLGLESRAGMPSPALPSGIPKDWPSRLALKIELQRELDLPRVVGAVDGRCDLPEVCHILVIPLRGSCEVRVVREVEELRTELQVSHL